METRLVTVTSDGEIQVFTLSEGEEGERGGEGEGMSPGRGEEEGERGRKRKARGSDRTGKVGSSAMCSII